MYMKNLIVAYSKNRVIGQAGKLPWQGELPVDMRHFRQVTMGHALIMGRLTFESIGRPLPGRDNIVLSKSAPSIIGCKIARDIQEAYNLVENGIDSFVIGGEAVFGETIGRVDRLYVTEIDATFEGDRYFPEIDDNAWTVSCREPHERDDRNRYDYSFVIYDALR